MTHRLELTFQVCEEMCLPDAVEIGAQEGTSTARASRASSLHSYTGGRKIETLSGVHANPFRVDAGLLQGMRRMVSRWCKSAAKEEEGEGTGLAP